jgi:hypothetical protein
VNSFLIKGWAITLASAFLGVALKDDAGPIAKVAFLAILPTLCFWLLDAYYLAAERVVRGSYGALAGRPAANPRSTLNCGSVRAAWFARRSAGSPCFRIWSC